jgi:hypothetical protein
MSRLLRRMLFAWAWRVLAVVLIAIWLALMADPGGLLAHPASPAAWIRFGGMAAPMVEVALALAGPLAAIEVLLRLRQHHLPIFLTNATSSFHNVGVFLSASAAAIVVGACLCTLLARTCARPAPGIVWYSNGDGATCHAHGLALTFSPDGSRMTVAAPTGRPFTDQALPWLDPSRIHEAWGTWGLRWLMPGMLTAAAGVLALLGPTRLGGWMRIAPLLALPAALLVVLESGRLAWGCGPWGHGVPLVIAGGAAVAVRLAWHRFDRRGLHL